MRRALRPGIEVAVGEFSRPLGDLASAAAEGSLEAFLLHQPLKARG